MGANFQEWGKLPYSKKTCLGMEESDLVKVKGKELKQKKKERTSEGDLPSSGQRQ